MDGVGAYFRCFAPGKRSLALDTRRSEAQEIIRQLLPQYDVLVEGFKPGVMEAMGLDPGTSVEGPSPSVIARISGYGQSGPMRDQPGHDINYISLTGMLSAHAIHNGQMALPAVQIADMVVRSRQPWRFLAALVQRFRTGAGQVLDVSLTEAALALASPLLAGAIGENRALKTGASPCPVALLSTAAIAVRMTVGLPLAPLNPSFRKC